MLFLARLALFAALFAPMSPAAAEPLFEREAICRATIAAIADRDPKAVKVARTVGEVVFLTYDRPVDNFVWAYRCRIDDHRVIWASEPGRWRDAPKDDQISFDVVGAGRQLRITVRRRNGAIASEVYDRDQIY
jgi:hypothetical protein